MSLRAYREDDFAICVKIVNKIWDFDGRLEPPGLGLFVKQMYVGGSLAESRYFRVVEVDGRVRGFLFGKYGPGAAFQNQYRGLRGQARTAIRFVSLRKLGTRDKLRWLKATNAHEIARTKVQPRTEGEITLFAVDPTTQGMGYGRALLENYVARCQAAGIERLTVETDVHSNYGFYEHCGFVLVGEFYSQMNELFTGASGEAFVYELLL